MTRTAGLLGAMAMGLVMVLGGGCSVSSGPTPPATPATSVVRQAEVTADHNDTDLAYADRVGSQHQQAVDMVAMVGNRDVSPELRGIAAAIGRDRTDEVEVLRQMARAWGVPPHRPDFHGNPGELTMEQLSGLYELDGAAFEKVWTQRMLDNHLGAVAMSKAEVDDGLNLGAREFARGLIRLQESQAERLQALG